MPGSFGRKGLDQHSGGAMAAPQGFGAARVFGAAPGASVPQDDGASPELRAFLAAERANRAPEPGLSEIARNGGARNSTTTRRGRGPDAQDAISHGGTPAKSMILAYVLWYFGAAIAAHRFYLGATSSALAMLGLFWGGLAVMLFLPPVGLLMLGVWLLWVLADLFLIPGLVRASAGEDKVAAIFG